MLSPSSVRSFLARSPPLIVSVGEAPWPDQPDVLVPAMPAGDIDMVRTDEGGRTVRVVIDRSTIFGNPFEMGGVDDRDRVVSAYRQYLKGGADARVLARRYNVKAADWHVRKYSFESRMRALSRLAERVRGGERLRLCCSCGSTHEPVACHGDVIVEWVRSRS